jgi:hypothetical protein
MDVTRLLLVTSLLAWFTLVTDTGLRPTTLRDSSQAYANVPPITRNKLLQTLIYIKL